MDDSTAMKPSTTMKPIGFEGSLANLFDFRTTPSVLRRNKQAEVDVDRETVRKILKVLESNGYVHPSMEQNRAQFTIDLYGPTEIIALTLKSRHFDDDHISVDLFVARPGMINTRMSVSYIVPDMTLMMHQ